MTGFEALLSVKLEQFANQLRQMKLLMWSELLTVLSFAVLVAAVLGSKFSWDSFQIAVFAVLLLVSYMACKFLEFQLGLLQMSGKIARLYRPPNNKYHST